MMETPAEELIHAALSEDRRPACLTCSFQAEDMVALHMVRRIAPGIPVLFLDTGYHFPETYAYRDRMARLWNLNLTNLTPALTVREQESRFGVLYESQPPLL